MIALTGTVGTACLRSVGRVRPACGITLAALRETVHRLLLQFVDTLDLLRCQELAVLLVILLTQREDLLTVVELVLDGFLHLGISHL